ncbi:MAG TPA: hypothetical protein DEP84_17360 [Chloroflexi bacterium]|nr:hypothetical protein [Chloroflexota bacterium]
MQAAGRSGGLSHETIRRFPCLVLIDEWVAYARQLHDQSDLPAGSFETQFTLPLHYERASGSNDRSVACLAATLDCVRRTASLGSRPARTCELIEETAVGRRAD